MGVQEPSELMGPTEAAGQCNRGSDPYLSPKNVHYKAVSGAHAGALEAETGWDSAVGPELLNLLGLMTHCGKVWRGSLGLFLT